MLDLLRRRSSATAPRCARAARRRRAPTGNPAQRMSPGREVFTSRLPVRNSIAGRPTRKQSKPPSGMDSNARPLQRRGSRGSRRRGSARARGARTGRRGRRSRRRATPRRNAAGAPAAPGGPPRGRRPLPRSPRGVPRGSPSAIRSSASDGRRAPRATPAAIAVIRAQESSPEPSSTKIGSISKSARPAISRSDSARRGRLSALK